VSGATVLVVDDNSAITAFVRSALQDDGYRVVSAVAGQALEVACERGPAAVLLDLAMPEMDGAEVSRRLRAHSATPSIPILLMSAQYDLRGLAAHLPVNERLAKPFDLDRLSAVIAKWETVTAGERLCWRVCAERSFAFDWRTRQVVA
jgi:CheY-like chemotaxis protein